ncbi:MAG: hypothetical protein ACLP56_01705, partial [Candidatus Sulfotelmatobacter sp.]
MIRNTFRGSWLKELAGRLRSVEVASLFMACMLILVEGCLGSSNPSGVFQVVASTEGLSAAVQASDGTYEIQTEDGAHSVIHARVAAEIDHKWVKSTDYPKHQISQSTFEDALGHGKKITMASSGLPNVPDLAYILQIYEGRAFGVIEVELQNHTANAVTIQSIRSVEAIGSKIIDLGGARKSDRVLSDSFSEDWPPTQVLSTARRELDLANAGKFPLILSFSPRGKRKPETPSLLVKSA